MKFYHIFLCQSTPVKMWKFSFIFFLVISMNFSNSFAQNSEIAVTEPEVSGWKFVQTNHAEIFRFKDTTRWMIRWDAAAMASPLIQSYFVISGFDFTFEFLPLKDWSIGLTARLPSSFSSYKNYQTYPEWHFGMEIRNYIRPASHNLNMNGLYWSLRGETGKRNILIDEAIQYQGYQVTGRMGFQALLSKQFFVDLSLGLGADYKVLDQYTVTSTEEGTAIKVVTRLGWKPIADPQIKLGFALSRPRPTDTRKDLWLRGQSTKTIQYKIDLFGLFNHNLSGISTALEMEKAFGKSGFSINFGAGAELHRPEYVTGADQDQLYVEKFSQQSFQVYAEPRWYYNIKKRLRKNLTNNVFSGSFFSLLMGYQRTFYMHDFEYKPYVGLRKEESRSGVELCWGMQRSFFNVMFAECRLGGSGMLEHSIGATGRTNDVYLVAAVGDIKIGLKF